MDFKLQDDGLFSLPVQLQVQMKKAEEEEGFKKIQKKYYMKKYK
jgi:hypothetical protein